MIINARNRALLLIITTFLLSACGSGSSSSVPTTVPSSATVFYSHNLVFKNTSTLLSTGYNGFGQLGSGNLGNSSVPAPLSQNYPFTGFAAGGNHSVAFTNNSSAVYSWGYNGFGQLGNGATTYSSVPVRSGTLTGVKAVAAGAYHTLALKDDNTVWAWGSNLLGQLGVKDIALSLSPTRVTGTSGFGNISSIASNGSHTLAIAKGGDIWAWGFNLYGQVGVMSGDVTGAIADPQRISALHSVLKDGAINVAAGSAFSYAVLKDGTLWGWGANYNGQLGNGSRVSSFTPTRVMISDTASLANVVQAAGGLQHGLARLANGEVWAWGYNFYGQLGMPKSEDRLFATKVPLTGAASEIRAFGSSSMARIGNAWYVWGDNTFGQLGTGSIGIIETPIKMSGF